MLVNLAGMLSQKDSQIRRDAHAIARHSPWRHPRLGLQIVIAALRGLASTFSR
jgi:hypothetical protein